MNGSEGFKYAGDAISFATVAGAVVGWLPSVATLLTIIWMIFRIRESYLRSKAIKAKIDVSNSDDPD